MGMEWKETPEEMLVDLATEYARAIHTGVYLIFQRYTGEIESWMKSNAPWTDRTGNARQTLYAEVTDLANRFVELEIGQMMSYGIFLELANAGRYAILGPAIDYFLPKIWADVQLLVKP